MIHFGTATTATSGLLRMKLVEAPFFLPFDKELHARDRLKKKLENFQVSLPLNVTSLDSKKRLARGHAARPLWMHLVSAMNTVE